MTTASQDLKARIMEAARKQPAPTRRQVAGRVTLTLVTAIVVPVLAFLALGMIFISTGTLWCLGIAAFAARAARRIRQSANVMAWISRVLGGLFVYLGIRVAMLEAR